MSKHTCDNRFEWMANPGRQCISGAAWYATMMAVSENEIGNNRRWILLLLLFDVGDTISNNRIARWAIGPQRKWFLIACVIYVDRDLPRPPRGITTNNKLTITISFKLAYGLFFLTPQHIIAVANHILLIHNMSPRHLPLQMVCASILLPFAVGWQQLMG